MAYHSTFSGKRKISWSQEFSI